MQENRYFTDDSKAMKDIEASRDLLAFMAFNLKTPVRVNRMYFEGSENKILILTHFTFRGNDWILQRDVVNDRWAIKKKPAPKMNALFTERSKQDIIDGKL
ncbi:hypothetical protein [Stenotrophomonas phage RAS14]